MTREQTLAKSLGGEVGAVIDPIRFEVLRNGLVSAMEEMGAALQRSAYSTNIKTRLDYSCCMLDRDLRTVAQSFSQPNHLGSMARLLPWAIREYGEERLGPGDALMVNDPYHGGGHLNDIMLVAPVHISGRLIGYVANVAHHVDVGGGAPASIGAFKEVYQEGIQVPGVRLVSDGVIDEDVFRLLLAQVRAKRETAGDLRAQIAANTTGARRLHELFTRFGEDDALRYIDELIEYTDRRTRAGIRELPDGVCKAVGFLDDDGYTDQAVRLQVRVEIRDDRIHFNLEGSDAQRKGPVNATYSQSFTACAFVLKCLLDADVPVNDGFYRALTVDAPEGTVVNCTYPAPVVGGWEVSNRLTDTIFKALSSLLPKRVPAATKGMNCHAGFGGFDPNAKQYFAFLETIAGGYGGRHGKDGPDAVQTHGQNTENAPIEETEFNYPVQVLRYELIPDSEGAGRWRGGLGLRRDYRFPSMGVSFTILADRAKQRPWGLFGGGEASLARYVLNPDAEARQLPSKGTIELEVGDVLSYQTCGGGGYGPPLERDPSAVLRDVVEGKISVARAADAYGVLVDLTARSVDEAATQALRDQLRREAR